MKARVKATGEIVEVVLNGIFYDRTDNKERYYHHELDFNDTTDYWTRLEHQYAGMAMQGMMSGWWSESIANIAKSDKEHFDILVYKANELAHALVEKYKKGE